MSSDKFLAGAVTAMTPGGPLVIPGAYGWTPNAAGVVGIGGSGGGAPEAAPRAPKLVILPRLEPVVFERICTSIADAVCPRWRKDAEQSDDVPRRYDQQLNKYVKVERSSLNFSHWKIVRDDPAAVRRIEVSWGGTAMASKPRDLILTEWNERNVPVLVEIRVAKNKIAVSGFKPRSTLHNILSDASEAVHPFTSQVDAAGMRFRIEFGWNIKTV